MKGEIIASLSLREMCTLAPASATIPDKFVDGHTKAHTGP